MQAAEREPPCPCGGLQLSSAPPSLPPDMWSCVALWLSPSALRAFCLASRACLAGVTPAAAFKKAWSANQRRLFRALHPLDGELKEGTLEGGHAGQAWVSAVTPDGRRAVSYSSDGDLRVFCLESGRCTAVLKGHSGAVSGCALLSDGCLASCGYFDGLRVWQGFEAGSGSQLLGGTESCCRADGGASGLWAVAVTPDQRTLLTGGGGPCGRHDVRVWSLAEGRCTAVLQGHTRAVGAIAVTPDGRRAVSCSWDSTLRVWDLEALTCRHVLRGHHGEVRAMRITPDGTRVVSGANDGALVVWSLDDGRAVSVLKGHTDIVSCISLTSDGAGAVSSSWDRDVRVWDLAKGVCVRVLRGHEHIVWAVAVTPDGRHAVSGSADRTLRVWGLEKGGCRAAVDVGGGRCHGMGVSSVVVTPGGRYAVAGGFDGSLNTVDLVRWVN